MREVNTEITKEKAISARNPCKLMGGIIIRLVDKPANAKPFISNPATTKVTRYKAITEDAHLNNPKVIRLIGKRSKFITGFARIEKTVNPAAAKRIVSSPLAKTIPEAKLDTKYKAVKSIM